MSQKSCSTNAWGASCALDVEGAFASAVHAALEGELAALAFQPMLVEQISGLRLATSRPRKTRSRFRLFQANSKNSRAPLQMVMSAEPSVLQLQAQQVALLFGESKHLELTWQSKWVQGEPCVEPLAKAFDERDLAWPHQ